MKLSEAILLGDTLKKCNPRLWLSHDGSCGCAFGGALLAVGVEPYELYTGYSNNCPGTLAEQPFVREHWPWLTSDHLSIISHFYRFVAAGRKTIEELADYVRSIEPPDPPADWKALWGETATATLKRTLERVS